MKNLTARRLIVISLFMVAAVSLSGCGQTATTATSGSSSSSSTTLTGTVQVPSSELSTSSLTPSAIRPSETLAPLAGATVTLTDSVGTKLGEATTNSKGEYTATLSVPTGTAVFARAEKESGDKKIVASSSVTLGKQSADINPTTTARAAKVQELIFSKVGDLHKQGTLSSDQKKAIEQVLTPLIDTISEIITQVTSDTTPKMSYAKTKTSAEIEADMAADFKSKFTTMQSSFDTAKLSTFQSRASTMQSQFETAVKAATFEAVTIRGDLYKNFDFKIPKGVSLPDGKTTLGEDAFAVWNSEVSIPAAATIADEIPADYAAKLPQNALFTAKALTVDDTVAKLIQLPKGASFEAAVATLPSGVGFASDYVFDNATMNRLPSGFEIKDEYKFDSTVKFDTAMNVKFETGFDSSKAGLASGNFKEGFFEDPKFKAYADANPALVPPIVGKITDDPVSGTADKTAPTISSVTPTASATNVAVNSVPTITFSEAMDSNTLTSTTITLAVSGGAPVNGTVTYNATTKVATYTPASALTGGTNYTLTVTTGVKDVAGNALAGIHISTFTTVSTAPSAPSAPSVTAGSTAVTLSWTAVSGAATYNLYWGTSSGVSKTTGTKISGITSTPYSHTGTTQGTTYYYILTAVNSAGEESVASSQVQAATSSWTLSTLDDAGFVGLYTSMAVDSAGKVHAAYVDWTGSRKVMYGTDASGSWVRTTVHSGLGPEVTCLSIKLDATGRAHVSYTDGTKLYYATNAPSGTWSTTVVDQTSGTEVGYYNSLAIDGNGKIHISYYNETNADLKYATNASGSWVISSVDSSGAVGEYNAIAVDSLGFIHVSYFDRTNGKLKYARNMTGSWVTETVTSESSGVHTSIAVDASRTVHISSRDGGNRSLKYATGVFGSWAVTRVDTGFDDGTNRNGTAIVVDGTGRVHIGYQEAVSVNGNPQKMLKYAVLGSGGWASSVIDSSNDNGDYASIGLDSNGKVRIIYSASTSTMLKLAKQN